MPDSDGWRDLMTEGWPPYGMRVEVKGQQNLGAELGERRVVARGFHTSPLPSSLPGDGSVMTAATT